MKIKIQNEIVHKVCLILNLQYRILKIFIITGYSEVVCVLSSLLMTKKKTVSIFIEHKYSDRMQSQNSQLVLSIYTSENGNKGGLDVSLGKKFITREKAPEVGNAG